MNILEILMRRFLALSMLVLGAILGAAAQPEKDVEGGKDHPLLSRTPGYYLSQYETKEFDVYTTAYLSGKDAQWEGHRTSLAYTRMTGSKEVSMVQISRNYQNAIKKIGGQILYTDERIVVAKIAKAAAVTWVEISAYNDGRDYQVVIVEPKPMEQEVVADASALSQSIAATGKAIVYGIYFDTGKSVLKPESEPTLEQITKLLKQEPQLQLYVVGHTDNDGALDFNLKLSADRAAAVVKALVSRGINGSRLASAGVASYCPAASNKTEDGKAKNRRVELVARN
jgi:outer membrane protein OmpA-like peptidoglycan-associated protein